MAMAVDPARQHQEAGGIDFSRATAQSAVDRGNGLALNADIELGKRAVKRDVAAANHQIELSHLASSRCRAAMRVNGMPMAGDVDASTKPNPPLGPHSAQREAEGAER